MIAYVFSGGTGAWSDQNCSTGCPTCGCCNPDCGRRPPMFIVTVDSGLLRSEIADDIDALRAAGKRAINRPWVAMKQAPRRFGRDFK